MLNKHLIIIIATIFVNNLCNVEFTDSHVIIKSQATFTTTDTWMGDRLGIKRV